MSMYREFCQLRYKKVLLTTSLAPLTFPSRRKKHVRVFFYAKTRSFALPLDFRLTRFSLLVTKEEREKKKTVKQIPNLILLTTFGYSRPHLPRKWAGLFSLPSSAHDRCQQIKERGQCMQVFMTLWSVLSCCVGQWRAKTKLPEHARIKIMKARFAFWTWIKGFRSSRTFLYDSVCGKALCSTPERKMVFWHVSRTAEQPSRWVRGIIIKWTLLFCFPALLYWYIL